MSKKLLVKGAVFGILVGSIAGLLFNKKTGAKNQAKLKKAADKVTKRLGEEVGAISDITKRHYDAIVNKVIADLKEDKDMSKEAWDQVSVELKDRWKDINTETKKMIGTKVAKVKKKVKATRKK